MDLTTRLRSSPRNVVSGLEHMIALAGSSVSHRVTLSIAWRWFFYDEVVVPEAFALCLRALGGGSRGIGIMASGVRAALAAQHDLIVRSTVVVKNKPGQHANKATLLARVSVHPEGAVSSHLVSFSNVANGRVVFMEQNPDFPLADRGPVIVNINLRGGPARPALIRRQRFNLTFSSNVPTTDLKVIVVTPIHRDLAFALWCADGLVELSLLDEAQAAELKEALEDLLCAPNLPTALCVVIARLLGNLISSMEHE